MSAGPVNISQRKADHIQLCAEGDVAFRDVTTLFEGVRLVHNALPEMDADGLDISRTLFGKTLKAPLFIAAMTGGTTEALAINRELATLADELGIGFGVGSQRAMQKNKDAEFTYRVRQYAPNVLLLGNLGAVQATKNTTDEITDLAGSIDANAMCIHLNPAMELVQPGGDRDFRGCLDTLARLAQELKIPTIAKETGSGLSFGVGARLRKAGICHVDVSGAGGTSWVAVETHRARSEGNVASALLGEALWDWGVPTAASVLHMVPHGFETIIATGGVQHGLEVAKALALGAHAAGIARPVLQAHRKGGLAAARVYIEGVIQELRAVMVLVGAQSLADLARAPRILRGELREWYELAQTL